MDELISSAESSKVVTPAAASDKLGTKPVWETPKLEDVSEQVMAQPYIRFT